MEGLSVKSGLYQPIGPTLALDIDALALDEAANGDTDASEPHCGTDDAHTDKHDSEHTASLSSTASLSTISIISIETAMERLGFGWFQCKILIASGLCFSADGIQVMLLSFLTPIVSHTWHLNAASAASLTSTLFAGALVGTLIWGPLADSWGRRPVFLVAAAIIFVGGLATAVAYNYTTFVAAVALVGLGVGGLTVPFDILAEFLPHEGRGTNLLRIEYAWTMGVLYVVFISFFWLNSDTEGARRLVTLGCVGPCAVSLLVGYWVVPESPRWLASQGRTDEAMHLLRAAARVNGTVFPSTVTLQAVPKETPASVADLFLPQWRHITLCLWGGWFTSAFGYYGTMLVTTRVFSDATNNANDASQTTHTGSFDYKAIFISSLAEFVGTTLVIAVVDRAGRIPTQTVSYALAGVLLCAFCALANSHDESPTRRWTLIALGFGARVFEMAGTCVTWVATAEILSTDIRGTGHSTANAMARLGAFFCPFLVQGNMSLSHIGLVMLVVHVGTIVCFVQLPETAGREMGVRDHVENGVDNEAELATNDDTVAFNLPEPC